jgi:hypothetical protein
MGTLLKENPWFVAIMFGFSVGFVAGVALGITKHCLS